MMYLRTSLILIICFAGLQTGFAQRNGFVPVTSDQSNIHFSNPINETEEVNITMYDYLYNGGGVGVGDFNNDGLSDLFFSGNFTGDQLYLNQGKLTFKDITKDAGIDKNGWSTGVCVLDINNDGFDDIYVCRSGWYTEEDSLRNVLYINQGDLTFKEEAKAYRLDLTGHHVQAAPLDFDLDGDLDLYVMGHPGKFKHKADFKTALEAILAGEVEGDLLLENVGGTFKDITTQAKIVEYGYGLGLAITDLNNDRYPDIIVCNDFDEPDHCFINQQDGTFKDEALKWFKHTSNYSMGNDVGDINNDGLLDYISVDMAFESHERSKMNMASMQPEKFEARLKLGWNHQYMHNMLQLNSGLGNFQEISQLSGVAKTDWSWAPLFFDMNGDGYLDLFISNGYKRDTKNNDIQSIINAELEKKNEISALEAVALIPSVKIANSFFENNTDLTFSDRRISWGGTEKLNTNGAAYADLDGDGDLDLILNNVDTLASIYENRISTNHHYLTLDLNGLKEAEYLGARFELTTRETNQVREAYFVRGYQSTVERQIHFHWAETDEPNCLVVRLPNGKSYNLKIKSYDKAIKVNPKRMMEIETLASVDPPTYFKEIAAEKGLILNHVENEFDDFEEETLLPHKMSANGPVMAVGDINNDGMEDIILGSAVGRIPSVILQQENGRFARMKVASFFNHQMSEDAGISIFDVNRDSKKDLFISSGGYQYAEGDSNYVNRVYIGNGVGNFGYVNNAIPFEASNSGKVIAADYDQDGDTDFFICGAVEAGRYPHPGKSTLLVNEKGFFKDRTRLFAPELEHIGMVTDASFSDIDADGDLDLIVVGEWMDVTIFLNENRKLSKAKLPLNLKGWWSSIYKTDIDNDGDDDFLLGNAGLNNKFNASKMHPVYIYSNDFDDNGTEDIILSLEKSGKLLPVRGKECSTGQMPFLAEKFPTYEAFASSSLEEIYSLEKLNAALSYEANEFRSGILYNNGVGGFSFKPFSLEGQLSFINDFEVLDINGDGLKDIVAVGNRFGAEVETTRYDAANGICYLQDEEGNFTYVHATESGLFVPLQATAIQKIHLTKTNQEALVIANNNGAVQLFILTPETP